MLDADAHVFNTLKTPLYPLPLSTSLSPSPTNTVSLCHLYGVFNTRTLGLGSLLEVGYAILVFFR